MEYYSLNQYLKDTFGGKVYKIAIDGGFTCPNRDGTLDTRGCIFCSESGSGDFAQNRRLSVTEQIERGKTLVSKKTQSNKYIAYFQAFTNTYAPIAVLREAYQQAIDHPDIIALSIATRPDCLGEDILELLSQLNEVKPVWVELGLQTIHPRSASYIRRCYDLPCYDRAVQRLRLLGFEVITHVILGLPGETREDMLATVDYVGKSGATGIKLQLLHVLKGTDLAKEYEMGVFRVMDMETYVSLVCDCIALLPKDMVIHRMTGDGDKRILLAPQWSKDKKRVLNALRKAIEKR